MRVMIPIFSIVVRSGQGLFCPKEIEKQSDAKQGRE